MQLSGPLLRPGSKNKKKIYAGKNPYISENGTL